MKNNKHFTDALFEEFEYFNNEVDSVLTEDLDTMLNYYKNLQNWDKQELLKFLSKDPTWNNDREQGQYSKWILDKLNRNLLNSSHLGHLYDALKRFEDNKKYLKNKDINKFKSLPDIDTYLNDDDSYNELSHSQKVRQHRRDKQKVDLDNEAELVYEDSDWEIWIPRTYAASCKLGQGSSWCTASTETSEYFDSYSEDGDLFIILNKHDEKEKYQFHFESESYMDINDEEVEISDLLEKETNRNWLNELRSYDDYIDAECEELEKYIKLDDLSQKINSLELIKYPTHKDMIKELRKIIRGEDDSSFLWSAEKKIKNINLEIENSVEKLEPSVFRSMSWITQVVFEKNSKLKTIGDDAFYWCEKIRELEIPNSVTSIGHEAFYGCVSLSSITLPKSLTSIGNGAFENCRSLTNITIPEGVTSIGSYAFYDCANLTSIVIPNSVTSIGDSAFKWCGRIANMPKNAVSLSISDMKKYDNSIIIKTSNPYAIDYCIKNNLNYEKID